MEEAYTNGDFGRRGSPTGIHTAVCEAYEGMREKRLQQTSDPNGRSDRQEGRTETPMVQATVKRSRASSPTKPTDSSDTLNAYVRSPSTSRPKRSPISLETSPPKRLRADGVPLQTNPIPAGLEVLRTLCDARMILSVEAWQPKAYVWSAADKQAVVLFYSELAREAEGVATSITNKDDIASPAILLRLVVLTALYLRIGAHDLALFAESVFGRLLGYVRALLDVYLPMALTDGNDIGELLKALTSLFSSATLPLPLAHPDLFSLLSAAFSGLFLPISAAAFQLAAVDLIACLSSRRPNPEDLAQRVVELCRCHSQFPKHTRAFKPQVLGVRVSLVSYLLVRLIDGPDDPPKDSPLLEETCAVSLTQTKLLRDVVRLLKSSADKWQRMTTTAKFVLQHMLSAALVEGTGGSHVQKLDTKAFKTLVKQLCCDIAALAGACYPAAMTCLIVMSVHFRHIFTGSAADFATGTKETILGFIAEVLDGLQGFTESPSPFFPLNTGEVCKLPCSCGERIGEASKGTVECQDCKRRIHGQCLGVYHEAWRCDACSMRQAAYKSVRHLLLPLSAKVVLSGLTTRGRRVVVQSDRPADDSISTVDVRQVMGELDGGLLLPALTEDAIYACYCVSSLGPNKRAAAASLHALASCWTFKTERDSALQTYTSKDRVDLVEGLTDIGIGLRHVSLFLMMSVFTHVGDVSLEIHDHSLAALRRHFSTRLLKRVHSLLFRLISMASSSPFASLRRAATMSFVACSKQNASFLRRLPETRDMIHVMLTDHSARVRER
ncbi:MAG: uncharacterized protein KVP18_003187, partial [Porospora cf. gigantea A]|uniref:uncharacterized protein n=1 Tax=Porospora cf. gigantea A TaxID=2853593 RepID=UPI00355A47B7